jgi:hypothetical protein
VHKVSRLHNDSLRTQTQLVGFISTICLRHKGYKTWIQKNKKNLGGTGV